MNLRKLTTGVLLMAGSTGCGGGQTGDIGEGSEETDWCETVSETSISVDDAEAEGFAVADAIADMTAQRTGTGQELWFVAPVSVWTEHGLTPPPDRSTRALLSVSFERAVIRRTQLRDVPPEVHVPPEAHCQDAVALDFSLGLELLDLGISYAGSATSWLRPGQYSYEWGISGACDLPGIGTGVCDVLSTNPARELDANEAVELLFLDMSGSASTACLDEQTWQALPDVTRADVSGAELLAQAHRVDLVCTDGKRGRIEISARPPERACGLGWGYPVVLEAFSAEFGLTGAYSAILRAHGDKACASTQCDEPRACVNPAASEEEYDAHPEQHCSVVQVLAVGAAGINLKLEVQVGPDGTRLVSVSHWRSSNGEVVRSCYGQYVAD